MAELAHEGPQGLVKTRSLLRSKVRRVAEVFQGVFVCDGKCDCVPGAHFPTGVRGHAHPPEYFKNVGSLKPSFPHFETHFRQIETVFFCEFDI